MTLRGRVGTFYERQLSHQCLRRIAGVRQLVDRRSSSRERREANRGNDRGGVERGPAADFWREWASIAPSEYGENTIMGRVDCDDCRRWAMRLQHWLRIAVLTAAGTLITRLRTIGSAAGDGLSGARQGRIERQADGRRRRDLHPKGQSETPAARAEVKPDGTFVAGTYEVSDGAAEGDYIVTVEWFKPVQKRTTTSWARTWCRQVQRSADLADRGPRRRAAEPVADHQADAVASHFDRPSRTDSKLKHSSNLIDTEKHRHESQQKFTTRKDSHWSNCWW